MIYSLINPYVRFSATQNIATITLNLKNATFNYDHRFYYCVEGNGIIYVNDEKYLMKPGSFLLWKSGSKYSCHFLDKNFICITCNFDYFRNEKTIKTPIVPANKTTFNKKLVIEPNIHFEDNEIFNDTIYIPNFIQVDLLIKKLVRTYRENFKYCDLNLKSILLHLFDKITKYKTSQQNDKTKADLYEIVTYIHEHYKEDITNEMLANKFSYHPNYLSKLFYEKTGYSLHNYIIRYRLSRAVKKLMASSETIKEICEYVNIPDQHYFSRIFKKYYGITPQQMRKNK
jgi:AraC-like DNA-binding protein